MQVNTLTEDGIAELLPGPHPLEPINEFPSSLFDKPPKPAAILITLLRQNNAWQLLFIRRTNKNGDIHSGQVAFPGGALDASDINLEAAALREAHEELGILPQDVRILGRLQEFITISNFHVTPFVGVVPWPYPLSPSRDEVARAFTIPLNWLADSNNRSTKQRGILGSEDTLPVIYYKKYDNEILWGVSARITLSFLEAVNLNEQN